MKMNPTKRFAREGWNGRNMYIYLTEGRAVEAENWIGDDLSGDEAEYGMVKVLSHIDMMASDGCRVIGWLASQTDMLSDDWMEV